MRLLVVGAGGQVGGKLVEIALRAGHSVFATYRMRPPELGGIESQPLDKTLKEEVSRVLRLAKPEVVVDTGALHNVDYCESHPVEALSVNRDGTRNLAEATDDIGAKFVFVSTDYVFDGSAGRPYTEEDAPHPLSVYARSKLEGEQVAVAANPATVVARPSVIFSWVPPDATTGSSSGKPINFACWLVRQLLAGQEVRVVDDQVASPTLADDLAGALLALATGPSHGVFHTAGATPLNRYEFSVRLARRSGLPVDLVHPVSTAELRQAAPRPRNSSLRSVRLTPTSGYAMLDIESALDVFRSQMSGGPGPVA